MSDDPTAEDHAAARGALGEVLGGLARDGHLESVLELPEPTVCVRCCEPVTGTVEHAGDGPTCTDCAT